MLILDFVFKQFKSEHFDACFSPQIQSGCNYNLTAHLPPEEQIAADQNLHVGTIVCVLGARYKSYCGVIGRTFMIDAPKYQQQNYNLLIEVHNTVIQNLVPGKKLCDVYRAAVDVVKQKNPELMDNFLGICGYGVGLEHYEQYLTISNDNSIQVEAGMCFVVLVGFQNIKDLSPKDEKRAQYSLLIADTVSVNASACDVLTKDAKIEFEHVSYYLEQEEEVQIPQDSSVEVSTSRTQRQTRQKKGQDEEDSRQKQIKMIIDKKQIEYHKRKTEDKKKKKKSAEEPYSIEEKLARGQVACYDSLTKIPVTKPNKIVVDAKNDAVLIPLSNTHVPFHISTIKNVSKLDEGECVVLRVNFKSSGPSFGKNYAPVKHFPNSAFLKEISIRSKDAKSILDAVREINELKKKSTQHEREAIEKSNTVDQAPIKVGRGKQVPRLRDVYIRPTPKGKKTSGSLEAHENGLRFLSNKGETVDVLYSNVKHAFYQAATNDTIVLIHFHLRNAIMIGKKAQTDVQFYTEVMDEYDQLEGKNRRAVTDEEAIEEERRERQLKIKLNKEFRIFAKQVEEISNLEFDVPYRELEFYGQSGRSNVLLTPTVHCLVSLSEYPFFVLTLNEIENAHFERVKHGSRYFDIIFVLKDYSKPVVPVNSVQIDKLDMIKDWLIKVEIPYFISPTTYAWHKLMQAIISDKSWDPWGPNGWIAGDTELNREEDEDAEMDQEGNEEYAPSDSDSDVGAEDDHSEGSEDRFELEDEGEAPDEEEEEEEEEAKDWDELESEAKEFDKKKNYSDNEDSDDGGTPATKKRKTSSSNSTGTAKGSSKQSHPVRKVAQKSKK